MVKKIRAFRVFHHHTCSQTVFVPPSSLQNYVHKMRRTTALSPMLFPLLIESCTAYVCGHCSEWSAVVLLLVLSRICGKDLPRSHGWGGSRLGRATTTRSNSKNHHRGVSSFLKERLRRICFHCNGREPLSIRAVQFLLPDDVNVFVANALCDQHCFHKWYFVRPSEHTTDSGTWGTEILQSMAPRHDVKEFYWWPLGRLT